MFGIRTLKKDVKKLYRYVDYIENENKNIKLELLTLKNPPQCKLSEAIEGDIILELITGKKYYAKGHCTTGRYGVYGFSVKVPLDTILLSDLNQTEFKRIRYHDSGFVVIEHLLTNLNSI